MKYYRKNVGGVWSVRRLNDEEVRACVDKSIASCIRVAVLAKEQLTAQNITVTDEILAAIISKAAPSYDSIANDVIEEDIEGRK